MCLIMLVSASLVAQAKRTCLPMQKMQVRWERHPRGLDRPVSSPPLSDGTGGPGSPHLEQVLHRLHPGASWLFSSRAPPPHPKPTELTSSGLGQPELNVCAGLGAATPSVAPPQNHSPRLPRLRDKQRFHPSSSRGVSGTPFPGRPALLPGSRPRSCLLLSYQAWGQVFSP